MKAVYLLLLALVACRANADVITFWNFNSVPPDSSSSTGTNAPAIGIGTASLFGGATGTYASGSTADVPTDNTAWNLAITPTQGQNNKQVGVQFRVSTEGFEDIVVSWQQQNSGNSSKYMRFEYTLDGSNFIDGPVITATTVGNFVAQSVSLSGISGANENPNFAIRLVAEFESTAVGGADVYKPSLDTATYGSSGRVRLDVMTFSGNPPSGNNPPTISAISNQTTRANLSIDNVPFQIGDAETPADNLILTGASSNQGLIGDDQIVFGGSGSDRTVSIYPNFDVSGSATITIAVFDEGAKSNTTSFVVTILPENTAPVISSFTNYHTFIDTALAPIAFRVSDAETDPDSLIVDVSSSNPEIVPPGNLSMDGSGTDRTLTILAASQSGNTVITISASDGLLTTSTYFNVMVLPSSDVVLTEPFNYADGVFTTNSGGLWTTHSGTIKQTQITGGRLELRSTLTEDVNAILVGAPYTPASGMKLYASMRVSFSGRPSNPGEYFAHFRDLGGNFRARVYGSSSNAAAGMFRFGIANNSSAAGSIVLHPAEFPLNEEHLVVFMYDVGQSVSKLWIDPRSESDPSISATDNESAAPIGTIAFRQNTGIGIVSVDNLFVAVSFDEAIRAIRLSIARNGSDLEISWPTAASTEGYFLESTSDLSTVNWQRMLQIPTSSARRDSITIGNAGQSAYFRLHK